MTKKYCILILVAAAVAVGLRLPLLALRPMHTDEAVHAFKFAELLDKGIYRYDSQENLAWSYRFRFVVRCHRCRSCVQ